MRVLRLALAATAVVLLLITAPAGTPQADPVAATAVVVRVVDGDTIDVRDDVRGRLRIRVLGIDTPETKKPGYTVGCFGPEASAFAMTNLLGEQVAVQTDPTQDSTDRFGRTLAYLVRADGWDYSVEVVRAGMALAYIYNNDPVSRYPAIAAAQREAEAAGRGLWGAPCYGDIESVPR